MVRFAVWSVQTGKSLPEALQKFHQDPCWVALFFPVNFNLFTTLLQNQRKFKYPWHIATSLMWWQIFARKFEEHYCPSRMHLVILGRLFHQAADHQVNGQTYMQKYINYIHTHIPSYVTYLFTYNTMRCDAMYHSMNYEHIHAQSLLQSPLFRLAFFFAEDHAECLHCATAEGSRAEFRSLVLQGLRSSTLL